jgi:hypothetical protein
MVTHDRATPACEKCRAELEECRQRLRVARAEIDRARTWMESRALRLEGPLDAIDRYLDGTSGSPRPRDAGASVVTAFKSRQLADGDFEIHLNDRRPFRLPPMLARLLILLAEDKGRDIGDGLVGFKSRSYLLTALAASTDIHNGHFPVGRPARLRQAILTLRRRLARIVGGGDALVQTRRGTGFRLVFRKPDRR